MIADILESVIDAMHHRINNGEFTERGLSKVVGISQPQMNNLIRRRRKLSPEIADKIIMKLQLDLSEILDLKPQNLLVMPQPPPRHRKLEAKRSSLLEELIPELRRKAA